PPPGSAAGPAAANPPDRCLAPLTSARPRDRMTDTLERRSSAIGCPETGQLARTTSMIDSALSTDAAPHADGVPPSLPFPVVGVGASAGGLEAVTRLLEALPPAPGLALLLVMHLRRDVESHLPELLAKVTPLTVRQAEQGMKVEVDHVYVIPPDNVMTILD